MSTDKIVIRVSQLGKKYQIGGLQEPYNTLRDVFINSLKAQLNIFHRAPPDDGFWTLNDVSCDVEQGKFVGIIRWNRAGKSTLLKILSRITKQIEKIVELHQPGGSRLGKAGN